MDQFAQTNDLQKAIETVANGGETTNNDVAQFGIPPMPPTPENGSIMPEVKPLVPAEDTAPAAPSAEQILSQSMGVVPPAMETNPETTPAEAAPAVEEPAATNEALPAEDLNDVKQNILRDLLPLLDKTEKTPEEKFAIYKDAIPTMHDVKTIEGAYRAASGIADETAKANALLELMQAIDA